MSEGNVDVTIEGTQVATHVWKIENLKASCPTTSLKSPSTIASPTSSVTLHPTYSGTCSVFGTSGTITTTGCDYELYAGDVISDVAAAQFDLSCSSGNKIVFATATCEAVIESQTFNGKSVTNNTAASSKTVTANLESLGIDAVKTKDGFLCPLNGLGAANGEYFGESTLKGTNTSGVQVGITWE